MNSSVTARRPQLITSTSEMANVAERLAGRARIAFDLESNGIFAYRAVVCVVQLASADDVFLIDTLTASLTPLAKLLSSSGPTKIVHDVAFDARMLAEVGVSLGNVHDTSLAARMLGRTSTGLGALLSSELALTVDKSMQQHDWTERPFGARALEYLAGDVVHLEALSDKLWTEVQGRGIEAEVLCETDYRLGSAIAGAKEKDPRPPYVRIKGIERVASAELPILRRLCDLRERTAAALGVPPYKVLGNEVLLAIAHARPKGMEELRRVRGAASGPRAAAIARDVLRAVAEGATDGEIPSAERVWFERPRVPAAVARQRRAREARLSTWRRGEAKARGVDEQVILPGHCLKDLAETEIARLEDVANVGGIGEFRVTRDGEAILRALAPVVEPVVEPEAHDDAG